MAGNNPKQQEYVMDVLLRNYCRASEENEILYEEVGDLQSILSKLFQENADLRFRLKELGVSIPPSEFIILDDNGEEIIPSN